jgi:quercetin dioxygenase-like cupin family protein
VTTNARQTPDLTLVDVGAEGVALLTEPEWTAGDRNSRTVFKADSLRIVLTALRAGARLTNVDPDEALAIQPLQGEVAVTVGAQEIAVRSGQIVCVSDGEPWEIRAISESLLVLAVGRLPSPAPVRTE